MPTTTSRDGTTIAYDRLGDGAPVITAGGAFNDRAATAPLAAALAEGFLVLNYDRRGRGDSGDGDAYAVEREIEDIAALLDAAGGSGTVFGYSSGANLALLAAAAGLPIDRLVLYEPPFIVGSELPRPPADLGAELTRLAAAGRRGDAVELYQSRAIGMPAAVVEQMRDAPFRPALEAIAHTLAYDAAIIGDLTLPTEVLEAITIPALVLSGDQSPPVMAAAAHAVAAALTDGEHHVLAGQGHALAPDAVAPVITSFLFRR